MLTILAALAAIGTTSAATPPAPPADDLLAGPDIVETDHAAASIVEREFDGKLKPLEEDPYLVAFRKLDLTEEQRAALAQIDVERAAEFDGIVRDEYGLIVEVIAGFQIGSQRERMELLQRVREVFKSFSERGTLLDEMREHLTDEQLTDVERMTAEYFDARLESYGDMSERGGRARAMMRYRLEEFGRQIRQSIERQVNPARELFDELLAELGVTPEQEGKIRAIVQPLAVSNFQGKATPEDRRTLFTEIRKVLTEEQQAKLTQILLKRWRGG